MSIDPLASARREFARSAAYRQEQHRFFAEVERRHKEKIEDTKADTETDDLAISVVLATAAEVASFQAELDDYRTATTKALIENERRLEHVQAELDDMLAKAYVLPDGRRVFKTEDGLRVFDEHGVELAADDVDPDLIEDWRPRAEGYIKRHYTKLELLDEKDALHSFEERVELADERAKSGEMTKDELRDLRNELETSIPLSARQEMAGYQEPSIPAAARDFGFAATKPTSGDLKIDLPSLER